MVDEITRKHLQKSRVRGAPSTIADAAGMVGSYDATETTRHTVRAVSLALDKNFTVEELRVGQEKLAAVATAQKLRTLEPPLFILHGDPMENVPHEWTWQLVQPVTGKIVADEGAGIGIARVEGGSYIQTTTQRGFPDLFNLYTFFLGHYLPYHKQELTRPVIYHRVLEGIESHDPARLTLAVFIPYYLSLKRPPHLVTREHME
jgi:hypothetical protein